MTSSAATPNGSLIQNTMRVAKQVLIIGGGIGGMCAAIELRKRGVEVDLVEIDPEWRVYGAGISISGPTLRAFKALGLAEAVVQQGWCADGCAMALADGRMIGILPTPRLAGANIPGGGGIMRPVLARILSQATRAAGVNVRLGVTFSGIQPRADKVLVNFSDGGEALYDLAIGADGVHSKVRAAIFPEAPKPRFTGQSCWRAVLPRASEITRPTMYLGQHCKAGLNPVSADEMYLFFLDKRAQKERIDPQEWPQILREELAEFGGLIGTIRDGITPQSRIVYRPLETLLLPAPWHRGRVVLLGDAVHATTPHLASGAGIAVEDAIVLAEELERAERLETALTRYYQRRFERCRLVVENSLALGEIEQKGGSNDEHGQLMLKTMTALAVAI